MSMENWIEVGLKELSPMVIGGDWGKDPEFDDTTYDLAYCIRGSEFRNWAVEKGKTASLRKVKLSSLENRELTEGDILVEISGGGPEQPVGRVVLIDKVVFSNLKEHKVIFTNFLRLFRPYHHLNSNWIHMYLQFFYSAGKTIPLQGGSNNLRNLKFKHYEQIKIPLAPLPEQRAIVSKIEQLFSELDHGIASLRAAKAKLDIYRQAVLKKAFEGWEETVPLGDLADIVGGVTKGRNLEDKETIELPYLRVANVQDGYLDLTVVKLIEVLVSDLEKYRLEFEDVLFTEGGDRDKLGRGTIWKNEIEDCIHQNHIFRARIRNREVLSPYFLTYYAQSPEGKDFFFKHGKHTTNLASINKTVLSSLPIPVFPLYKQHQIVQEIESRLSVCDNISANIDEGLERAEALRQSILKKAFEGRLLSAAELAACRAVADWAPAGELLARIRKEK